VNTLVSCNGKRNTLMTKRLLIILTITAIISFAITFSLDITSFGQNTNISWKNIEVIRILVIILIVACVGLFLGLFLFRKQNYMKRIVVTIPIAFILFAFADIIMNATNYYGLNEEYNYFSANRDIKNGKIQILETGLILPEPNVDWDKKKEAEKKLEKQFGYKSVYLGCIVTHGIGIYNSVMESYLENIHGKNWRTKERRMVDTLINATDPK
jgi:small-conductance mechanosensitive channel